jgi:hypothetical protein
MMVRNSDALIAELVGELEPVRPLSFAQGLGFALAGAAVSALTVVGLYGLRADLAVGAVNPMHLVATGLYFGLALAATVTVVVMSRPQVGNDHSGWTWAAAMAALLPLAALVVAFSRNSDMMSAESIRHGLECFSVAGTASLLVFGMLVAWLRRGAPTAPDRAGLIAGVAAGSFGIFAFSLHCPDNDIVHIGLWHSAVVLAMAGVGRALVPRLIRW